MGYLEVQRRQNLQNQDNFETDEFCEKKINLYTDASETFFDEHIVRENLSEKLSEKRERDANVEERIRNYKNFAACLSLSERRSKAPEFYTTKTMTSPNFISPFSDGAFDFKQLT